MNTIKSITLGFASLLAAGAALGQQATTVINTRASVRDNPGTLGHSYSEISYRWHDVHRAADGYDISLNGNMPVRPGLDLGLGYNYFWANDSHNPFTLTDFDVRMHSLAASATFYGANQATKPFLTPILGYQWSRGDINRLRTYDSQWVWGASAGFEMPVGRFSFTPRATYTDLMQSSSIGIWHYGAELHTWLSETAGLFGDATYTDPQRSSGPQYWAYTGGLRFRF